MPVGAKDCKKNCMDYDVFFSFLKENGFEMVDKFNDCDRKRTGAAEGQWCGTWIDHFAWRLKGSAPDLKLSSDAQTDVSLAEKSETSEKAQDESEEETGDRTEGAAEGAKENKEEGGTEDANDGEKGSETEDMADETEQTKDGEKEAESEDKADETEQTEESEKEAETEDKADETEETEEDKKEAETEDKADETEETKEGEEKEVAKPAVEKAEVGETDDKPADDEDKEEGEKNDARTSETVIETEDAAKDEKKGNEPDTLGAALAQRKAALAKKGKTRQQVNKDPKVVQMVSQLRLLKTRPADTEATLSGGEEKLNRKTSAKKASAKKASAKKAPAKRAPAKKAAPQARGKGRR